MWRSPRIPRRGTRLATLGYAAAWLAGAAITAVLAVTVLDSADGDEVTLPPVRETQLANAARDARCELVHAAPGDRLNPAVDGPSAAPAAPGVYAHAPSSAALVGALRHGIVVIHVGAGVPDGTSDLLADMQRAIPEGTIVAPGAPGMPFALAVTAYRRLLACPRYTAATLDAARLFRGRFLGTGPDR